MRKFMTVAVLALALSGCGNRSVFGAKGPDEFRASRLPPLVVPPDFALVPPKSGSAQAQAADSSTEALQAMFGGPAPRSPGEASTISRAGGSRAQDGIRTNAGDPDTQVVDKGSVTRDIIAAPQGDGAQASASTDPQ